MKLLAILLLFSLPSYAYLKPEAEYQKEVCKGQTEVILSDRTRVDCETDTHVIEFDFAPKYYEAVGQSLHYSVMTGKRAGIGLIIEEDKDMIYFNRLMELINYFNLPIDAFAIDRRQ